jgi:hypothetical protein
MKKLFVLPLLFLWELPQNFLGIMVFAIMKLRKTTLKIQAYNHLLCIETKNVGISLGWFVFWTPSGNRFSHLEIDCLLHELGHARQSVFLGPFYLLIIGIPSLARVFYGRIYSWKHGVGWTGYFTGFPENWADRLGGVKNKWE